MVIRVFLALRPGARPKLARLLTEMGCLTTTLEHEDDFWKRIALDDHDVVLLDRGSVPSPWEETIESIRRLPDRPEVLVAQENPTPEDRARILSAGALACVDPSLSPAFLRAELEAHINRRTEDLLVRVKSEEGVDESGLASYVTKSPAMRDLIQLARKVAGTDTSVLLLGETGVGKEWLARAIHADGTRPGGSFIAVNCGALPETLLESELFGHEEGAFTGASRPRRGRFELAHKGTIFLDEIAEMPLHLQVKLLRVLQTKTIQRLGSEDEIQTDVRIMAATNRDLDEAVRTKQFRPDLYYRLAVVNLRIPPLRERREDIEELAQSYLEVYRQQLGRPAVEIRADAMEALIDHAWPGNVRELINVIERAVLLAAENEVGLEDLPQSITPHAPGDFTTDAATPSETDDPESRDTAGFPRALFSAKLPEARHRLVEEFERRYLSRLLTKHEGRIGPTARSAGITPRALYEKMKNLGLAKEDFKD